MARGGGTPGPMSKFGPKPTPPMDRFLAKVEKTQTCWLWKGAKNNMGYGMFMLESPDKMLAHRASWLLAGRELTAGLNVLHQCDTPACVNPDHMTVGSQRKNMKDMVARRRDRHVAHPGKRNGNSLLSDDGVRQIRERYARGERQHDLAVAFGVCGSLISAVVTGRAWKHVDAVVPEHDLHEPYRGLTDTEARRVRHLYRTTKVSQSALAERFCVHPATISSVILGKTHPSAGGPVGTLAKHQAKLNAYDWGAIKVRLANGETQTAVAASFGVTKQAIAGRLLRERLRAAEDT